MDDKYLNNNPDFAYKLFSTMGVGCSEMSNYENNLCERIWDECNHVRSDVLIKCVQICGNVDTPLARYVRAKAWSWNLVMYSENAISAIIDYLNHDLYEDAFKDNLVYDNYSMRKNNHLFNMYLDLGKAYEGARKYDKAIEVYNESKKFMNSQIPYLRIAERYKIMKEYDKALEELDKAKSSKYAKYPNGNEHDHNYIDLRTIETKYKEISNSRIGICKHEFIGYDKIECIDDVDRFLKLKKKYETLFEERRKTLETKDLMRKQFRENETDETSNNYINICKKDIELAIKTKDFYDELNKFTNNHYEVNDNYSSGVASLRDLVLFYKKRKMYSEAIEICDIAIKNDFKNYSKDKTYDSIKNDLMKKL